MKKNWWKILCIVLLFVPYTAGFIAPVPRLDILNETIRNLYFHVPMWFGMTLMLFISIIYSILHLSKNKEIHDWYAVEFARSGIFFGILGLLTGMIWAKFTWGTWWTRDPKLNAAAIGMFIYMAYFVLRDSIQNNSQKTRISAVYNIFAFPTFIALIYILPRITDSLHPGNGGNPGFNAYDRDKQMNLIFYSANIGYMLLGVWFATLRVRLKKISETIHS